MTALRALLADDHALVRAGIRVLLESFPEVEVVGEASTGYEALQLIAERRPAVALVNISMPELNGLETTGRATKSHPLTRIIVFSMHADEEYIRRAFAVGAAGYLVKHADRNELELAIRAVARGDTWVSPAISKTLVAALARGEETSARVDLLTKRQREVLQLIAEGHSTKEVAHRLALSTKTVEAHRSDIMDRLGVRGIPALVRWAIRVGIVEA